MNKLKKIILEQEEKFDTYKTYTQIELKVKDAIIKQSNKRFERLKNDGRMTRALLRIPRLTDMYQRMMRKRDVDELECLQKIYNQHF